FAVGEMADDFVGRPFIGEGAGAKGGCGVSANEFVETIGRLREDVKRILFGEQVEKILAVGVSVEGGCGGWCGHWGCPCLVCDELDAGASGVGSGVTFTSMLGRRLRVSTAILEMSGVTDSGSGWSARSSRM